MEIKCYAHPNCNADAVCEECGFLCTQCLKPHSKKHFILFINDNISMLYNAYADLAKANAQSSTLAQIKIAIDSILDTQKNNAFFQLQKAQTEVNKTLLTKLGITPIKLQIIIKKSLKTKREELLAYVKNTITDMFKLVSSKVTTQLNNLSNQTIENSSKVSALPKTTESSMVHFWKGMNITRYDPIKKYKTVFNLNQSINDEADSITYGKRIYILGGNIISSVFEFDLQTNSINSVQPMNIKKYWHSLCCSDGHIYSIGGYDNSKDVSDCEKYNVKTNSWAEVPMLISPRNSAAVFVFNNKYIYLLCGYNSNLKCLNSMDRLDIASMNKWENVTLIGPPTERYNVHGIQINVNQAMVFGGIRDGKFMNDSYIMNISDDKVEFKKGTNLGILSGFYCTAAPVMANGSVYAVDWNRKIHKYDNEKWEVIE